MTREENLHWLNKEIEGWENECQSKHPIKEALYAARKALEKEPCEDAISRKEVRDTIFRECSGEKLDIDFAKVLLLQRAIKALPPVTPQEPFKPMVEIDLYSVIKQKYIEREVLDKIRERVEKLQKACGKDDLNLLAQYSAFGMVLDIIDEYRLESEVKANENEK